MSVAPLHLESEPIPILLTAKIAFEFGLIVRRRCRWSLTNIADKRVVVHGQEVPMGVAASLRPLDVLTIGEVACQFIPVMTGGDPNE